MEIFLLFIKIIFAIIMISFCSIVLTFFISIFLPENVQTALNIFKNLFQIP